MAEKEEVTTSSSDDKPDEKVTFTKAEVDALVTDRLKGQGKELKRLQAENAKHAEEAQKRAEEAKAAAEAKAIENGEAIEVVKSLQSQLKASDEKIAAYEAKEAEREKKLKESNDARIKALPEKYHDWPLPADLEQAAIAIGKLEELEAEGKPKPATRTRTMPPVGGNNESAESYEAKLARLHSPEKRGDQHMGRK